MVRIDFGLEYWKSEGESSGIVKVKKREKQEKKGITPVLMLAG